MPSIEVLLVLGAVLCVKIAFVALRLVARRRSRRLPDLPANPSVTTSSTH